MAYITRSFYHRYYKHYKCSELCCFVLIVYGLSIVFPFFVAYETDGFWDLMKEYYEQPQMSISDNIAIECSNVDTTYFYTNIDSLTSLNNFDLQPSIISTKIDQNDDTIPDSFTFTIEIPYLDFNPQSCVLMLVYNLGFRDILRIQMQAPLILQFDADFGSYSLMIQGNLEFNQKNAILVSKVTRNVYNNTNFMPVLQLIEIQKQLLRRNETISASYRTYNIPQQNQKLSITLDLKVPIFQKLLYIPTVLDSLKSAWEQFLYLFLPTFFLLSILIRFSVKRKIFYSQISSDLPSENSSIGIQ